MHSETDAVPTQTLYALVIYLPSPLGPFLDELRLKLVPGCNPHAHVSVLPPRTLPGAPEAAIAESREILSGFAPFEIRLGEIEKFERTDVVYIALESGEEQLREMHRRLNAGILAFDEPFVYHPHVTLAQEIPPERVAEVHEKALQMWRGFSGSRTFLAEAAVFVRNTKRNFWIDIASEPLLAAAPAES